MSEPTHPEVAILNAALELPAAERSAYLDNACAGNAALRARMEELLRAHEQANDFLEAPPAGLAFKRTNLANVPVAEKAGDKIGRYKLLEQIGEGGCGVVYVAEQQEPVRRRVALKIIKLGMDTKSVIARFEAERQALALMDHPNIAKIFDAGVTNAPVRIAAVPAAGQGSVSLPDEARIAETGAGTVPEPAGDDACATVSAGRPYFVMELVRGVKITDYCDQNHLSARERLDLFIQVCRAVQHAHQKGVIHRDLKPSNILVTVNDGVPVPKVIDFGIAKATQGRLTDQTVYTAFEQFIGTPAYMSPEQAAMTSLDIDTRSDIYSLGVLLYELLTGKTPFDQKVLLAAGLDEMCRTIREKEPLKPSTRLTQELVAADVRRLHSKSEVRDPKSEEEVRASSRRLLRIKETIHLVRGDLDWIVMKCLEKDRTRRYETANGLASDIQRHLNCEPVIARPPSRWYEFQKTVRRHKVGFAATGAVMASLLIGLAVSTWMFVRERQEHARENAARQESETARAKSAASENLRLATLLYNVRRYAEAEQLLDQVPPDLVQPYPQHVTQRLKLGWWHGLNEEWAMAATNFAAAIRFEHPTNWDVTTDDHVIYAAALLEQADISAYDGFRRTVIARYLQTTNPVIAERLCRIGLTLPADAGVMRSVDTLYQVMKREQDDAHLNQVYKPWECLGLALVDYRRANYPQAIEWCNQSRMYWTNKADLSYEATAHAILALAHQELGQEAPARFELAESRRCIEEQPYSGTDTIWPLINGLYAETLLHEAAVRIEGASPHDPGRALRQQALGELYADGRFVNKDPAKALDCFRKADDGGLAKHQYQIGLMYARGVGTPTNLVEAYRWFSKAASHTNSIVWANFEQWGGPGKKNIRTYAAAWIQLGLMCAHGQGVPEDAEQAKSWFQKVAEDWSHGSSGPMLLNHLAWSLATARDPNARFGPAAVFLAEMAVTNCGVADKPLYLDTLAAAHAEAGDFTKAVGIQKEAIGLLTDAKARDDFTTRLKLYELNMPCREGN